MIFKKNMFSVFLTKKIKYWCTFVPVMKCRKTQFNHLILCLLCFLSVFGFTQDAKTQLKAPDKLVQLLAQKIELDRKMAEKKQFTIQVHYGDFESTTAIFEEFKTEYPNMPSQLVFETPNYKIRAGSFATEREALEVLNRIKRRFKAAFVLKP